MPCLGVAVLTVSRLSRLEEVEQIRAEWADLHAESSSINPFLAPEWTINWMRTLMPASERAWIIVFREDDRLVGIAPMRLYRYGLGIRRMQMIGTSPPQVGPFEIPAVLAAPAAARHVARMLVDYLTEHREARDIATVSFGETTDWLEPGWLPKGFTATAHKTTPFVVLPLPISPRGPTEGRRNLREAVRRSRSRLNKRFGAGGWHVEAVTDAESVRCTSDDLVRLHRCRSENTSRGERHTNVLADADVRRFMLDLISDLAERKQVKLYRLIAGGEILAIQLVLTTATAAFISVSGFRDDAWDLSPTNYLQWLAVTDAADRRMTEVNLSAAPTQAKLRWSRTVRVHPEFLVVGPSRFARYLAGPAFLMAVALSGYWRDTRLPRPGKPGRLAHLLARSTQYCERPASA